MSDWTREYRSLKQKINTMDKDIFKLLTFTKTTTLKNEIQGLIEFEEKKEFERHVETEELHTFISSLRRELANLKDSLKNYSKNPASLSRIQEITEKLEDKISKFKEKQMVNFDRLLEEEAALSREIELIADKLETYETPVEIHEITVAPKGRTLRAASLKPRTLDTEFKRASTMEEENKEDQDEERENIFEPTGLKPSKKDVGSRDLANKFKEQIENINLEIDKLGGATAGWDAEDHQIFLKVRTKHKNNVDKIAFLNDCITSLPFYGEEQIQEHIQKFKRYLQLDEEKKNIAREYKENKENQKRNLIEAIRLEDAKKEEAQRQIALQGKLNEEREKNKEKLKEWKARKMAKQAVEEEKVKEIEIIKKKDKETIEKSKRDAAQKRLQEYKEKKEIEKIREKEREEYKKNLQKRRLDKEELDRIREKEENLLKKNLEKIALLRKKEQEKAERTQKLIENATTAYSYVESRLNEETKAIAEKKRDKFDPKRDGSGRIADTFGGDLTRKFGRAIPSWRQGLS